jgi:hypothetical protein
MFLVTHFPLTLALLLNCTVISSSVFENEFEDSQVLMSHLINASNEIYKKYNFLLIDNSSSRQYSVRGVEFRNLAERLSDAYFGRTTFVIGVTGGSASQGSSWSALVASFLDELGVDVELRNAAQGSTSQVVTAPCIEQLVGPNVDLLLWEFAMNDIANVDQSHTLSDGHNQICSEHPIRCFAADAWIREAIRYKPSGIGFIHLWDIGIHKYELNASDGNIPDRAWKATNAAMHHYASIYGSYFSINIIRMITLMKLFKYKREFLRDVHHPNDHGYRVTADLFNWVLLQN